MPYFRHLSAFSRSVWGDACPDILLLSCFMTAVTKPQWHRLNHLQPCSSTGLWQITFIFHVPLGSCCVNAASVNFQCEKSFLHILSWERGFVKVSYTFILYIFQLPSLLLWTDLSSSAHTENICERRDCWFCGHSCSQREVTGRDPVRPLQKTWKYVWSCTNVKTKSNFHLAHCLC